MPKLKIELHEHCADVLKVFVNPHPAVPDDGRNKCKVVGFISDAGLCWHNEGHHRLSERQKSEVAERAVAAYNEREGKNDAESDA